ncbi:MAG TPA: hypothetical protein VMM79_06805 [Longimicrobiales bacterium]|nr:hypothetical protein [Longimicrobiales bacterium]
MVHATGKVMVQGDFLERRFSDDELRRILEDAAEAGVRSERSPVAAGYTISEIRDIAREAGIDRADIDRAAANLIAGGTPPSRTESRLPFAKVLHHERVIPRRLTDREMRWLIRQVELVVDRPGTMVESDDLAEWRDEKARVYVGVARGRSQTRLRVITDESGVLIGGSLLIGVMGFSAMPAATSSASSAAAVAGGLLVAGATGALVGLYWKWRNGKTRREMRELLDILGDAIPPTT